jgi:hypothetical protein
MRATGSDLSVLHPEFAAAMAGEGASAMKIKVKKVEKIQATATMVEYAL